MGNIKKLSLNFFLTTFLIMVSYNNFVFSREINLKDIENRLSGWQLQSFLKSYNCKIEEGMSLFKKAMLKK